MNSRLATSSLAALLALAASGTAVADSAFYVGVGAGGATLDADIGDVGIPDLPDSIDEDDTAVKVFVGYDFDLPVIDLGIEAGYVDFGEPDIDVLGNELTLDTSGFNAWGIASIDVLLVDVYAKLGFIAWEVDVSLLDEGIKEDGTDIGYGLGAAFELGPLEVRGEFEVYDLDDADLSMLSLGLLYRF
ncbi:MAG: outer membrane beta-barrel protein [Pseudomonadota bacterium]